MTEHFSSQRCSLIALIVVLLLSSCRASDPSSVATALPSTIAPATSSEAAPPAIEPPSNIDTSPQTRLTDDWIMGFDASYVTRVEDKGGTFCDSAGEVADIFSLLQRYDGVDYIRLRVWVDPSEPYASPTDMLRLAKRADAVGMSLLIAFHFSDTWADPSQQTKPQAWQTLDLTQLQAAVYAHTHATVNALINQGTPPSIVQVGNEIGAGFLWPEGQVGLSDPTGEEQQWQQFGALLDAGIRGVHDTGATAKIMMHIAEGGQSSNELGRWFFDRLLTLEIAFDMIGLSYYPHWHGDLDVLAFNIEDLVARYGKPVIVVETSYMWTLDWQDATHNTLGLAAQLLDGFPASPAGQAAFFNAVVETAKPAGASGVFYWGGEWIATSAADTNGSTWENQALFDFNGCALPALDVFRLY